MTTHCFGCDGTGILCDICGESPKECKCTEAQVAEFCMGDSREQYIECEDCGGSGE